MKYEFKQQNNDERQKEAVKKFQEYWQQEGYDVEDVSEDPKYFLRGVDLIRILGENREFIDVKCDFQAHETGNVPFEIVEICPLDENKKWKMGWGYKNTIDEINYYIWESGEMIVVSLKKLREIAFNKERRGYASLHHKPIKYFTLGILIPIKELK